MESLVPRFETPPSRRFIPSEPPMYSITHRKGRVTHQTLRTTAERAKEMLDREALAVTTILLSVAGSDQRYELSELRETYKVLERRYDLSSSAIHRYVKRVAGLFLIHDREKLASSAIRLLKERKDKILHLKLFCMATRVAEADGRLRPQEIRWLRRLARELSLSVTECQAALLLSKSLG